MVERHISQLERKKNFLTIMCWNLSIFSFEAHFWIVSEVLVCLQIEILLIITSRFKIFSEYVYRPSPDSVDYLCSLFCSFFFILLIFFLYDMTLILCYFSPLLFSTNALNNFIFFFHKILSFVNFFPSTFIYKYSPCTKIIMCVYSQPLSHKWLEMKASLMKYSEVIS